MKSALLRIYLISLFYLPAFVPNTSLRIDYLISILAILMFTRKTILPQFNRSLLLYGASFSLANFFQIVYYQTLSFQILINSIGFLRPSGVYNFIVGSKYTLFNWMSKLFYSTFFIYPFIGVIDYFNIEPVNSIINLVYRFSIDNQVLGRATGIFQRVHGLAYFNVLAIIVLLTDPRMKRSKIINFFLVGVNLFSLVLTFSRSGLIFLLVVLLVLYRKYFFSVLLVMVSFIILIYNFFKESKLYNIIDSIFNGVKYIIGDTSFDERGAAFITARLEWGWGNSIQKFLQSPIFGNINKGVGDFVGDGGYVEILANQGILGLIGFVFLVSWFLANRFKSLRYVGLALVLLNIGASCFTERLIDWLIVYVFLLINATNDKKGYSLN